MTSLPCRLLCIALSRILQQLNRSRLLQEKYNMRRNYYAILKLSQGLKDNENLEIAKYFMLTDKK